MRGISADEFMEKTRKNSFNFLVLFFFGTLSLIFGSVFLLYGYLNVHNVSFTLLALGLALILCWFTIYYYLFVTFTAYGLFSFFRNFKKFYRIYFKLFAGIFILLFLIGIYEFLGGMKGIMGFLATIVAGIAIFWANHYLKERFINNKKRVK